MRRKTLAGKRPVAPARGTCRCAGNRISQQDNSRPRRKPAAFLLAFGARLEEFGDGLEGGVGDVVLDALGVDASVGFGDADGAKELVDGVVSCSAFAGDLLALAGEEDGPVGFCFDEPVALEPGDGAACGDVGDTHAFCDIDQAGFALGLEQILNEFGVVFAGLGGVVLARSPKRLFLFKA